MERCEHLRSVRQVKVLFAVCNYSPGEVDQGESPLRNESDLIQEIYGVLASRGEGSSEEI